jgi:hypothetical protein
MPKPPRQIPPTPPRPSKPSVQAEPEPLPPAQPDEVGGPRGPEPTRYGDWERNGRCIDF